MRLIQIVKRLAVLNTAAFAVAAAAGWLQGRRSVAELLETGTDLGLGLGACGALTFPGASAGSSASTGMAASAADQPSRIMDALWADRNAGISTGVLFVVSGIAWIVIAWLAARLMGEV